MSTTISTRTSNRIAAGVTAAYLRDLSHHQRRSRATAAAQRSAATASPPRGLRHDRAAASREANRSS